MANDDIYENDVEREIERAGRVARQQQDRVRNGTHTFRLTEDETTEENLLLPEELEQLWACEDEIRHGMAAYLRVAEALHTIQTKRLYREDYRTFAAYCTEKWNLTDRHARNMANAWEIAVDIDSDPIANAEQLPQNERQARELKQVPKERRAEVWEQAVATAGGVQHVCAHDVKEARRLLIDGPAEDEAREVAALERADEREDLRQAEPEVVIHDRDPLNHAMRIINKYGAEYAFELAEHISIFIAEKGLA